MAERRIIDGYIYEMRDGKVVPVGPADNPQSITMGTPDPSYQAEQTITANKAAASSYDPEAAALDNEYKRSQINKNNREAQGSLGLTPAQKKADEEFAKEYIEFNARGGFADVRKNLEQLNGALQILKENDTITGPVIGRLPQFIQQAIDPNAIDVKEQVEEVVQRNLRLILGAQFTEKEGERLISRAYNDNLQESSNVERLERLIGQIGGAAQAKESASQYYEQNGTLAGWKPPIEQASDATQQRAVNPSQRQAVEVADGAARTIDDPNLAGVNDAVAQMILEQKPAAEIGAFLESKGVNPIPAMGAIQENLEFQKQYPGTKPSVNVDDIQVENSFGKQTAADILNWPGGAAGVGYGNAMTAGYLDEIVDAAPGEQNTQQTKEYLRGQYPVASGLGELGGAVIGMKGAGNLLKQAPMLANTGSKGALAGDVAYGSLYGSGEANEDRLTGAAVGAGSTLLGNQIGQRVLAPIGRKALETAPVQAGVNTVRNALKKAPVKPAQKPEKTVSMVTDQAGQESIEALQEARDLGLPMALADTNPRLRTLAGSAVRKSPAAREFAESTIEPRARGQAERASQAVNEYLQPVGDTALKQEQLIEQARAQAGPLYRQAYDAPGAGAAFESIEPLLQRPGMRQAMREGQRIAADEGVDPTALGYSFNEAGDVVYERAPSWQSYDYAKRGLDDVIQSNNNPVTGGLNNKGRSAQQIKAKLLEIIDQRNPAYKQARDAYAGPVSVKTAIDQGRKAGNMKPDMLAAQMRSAGDVQAEGLRTGFAASLDDKINSAQMTGNPYKRVYGTPSQQQNMAQMFPEGAPQFGRVAEIEDQMAKTAYETLGGSPTAARVASDSLFDGNGMAGNAAEIGLSAATGVPPVNAMMQGIRNFGADGVRLGLGKRSEQRAEAIAPILLDTNPQAAIDFLNNALAERAAYEAWKRQASGVGGQAGAGLGVLATAPLVAN